MPDPILFLQDLMIILLSASVGGYICRKIGLSPVVGYICAGLVVGTSEIAFPYVSDEERISVIAQLGVVFLMFSIGLQFGLRRVREVGFRVILSTALTALLVLSMVRLSADFMGLSIASAIALAAVFMNSSSAIISKVIEDVGIGHERHGQLAMGTTLLEDIVAVVMLAIIGSYLAIEGGGSSQNPLVTVGLLAGFAILVFVVGSLILPRILRRCSAARSSEALTVVVAGILLLSALLAVQVGYSLALGAFLCGMIMAETRQKLQIERTFQGLKDIFLTVFFVTIGMLVDVTAIPGAIGWIVLGIVGALLGRTLAGFVSLLLVGEKPRTALQASLSITPLGEFSFIIAGIAVAGGLFGETFKVAVVGTVLGTSLISPLLVQHSGRLTRFLKEGNLPLLDKIQSAYSDFWKGMSPGPRTDALWKLLRKRVVQIGIEIIVVSMAIFFAYRAYQFSLSRLPGFYEYSFATPLVWTVVFLLILIPLVAIWRNLSVVSLILGEHFANDNSNRKGQKLILTFLFQAIAAVCLTLWFWNLLPPQLPRFEILGLLLLAGIPVLYFLWRYFIRLHSEVECMLNENLSQSRNASSRDIFDSGDTEQWGLNVREFPIPDDSAWAGKSLEEIQLRNRTGCSVVGLQRHGFTVKSINSQTQIFPGDELLLLGSNEQFRSARALLGTSSVTIEEGSGLHAQILRSLQVKESSALKGQSLLSLQWPRRYGIQIIALKRAGDTLTDLKAATRLEEGDTLLLLGSQRSLEEMSTELETVSA
jgi:CPA2 family monovalent cation:H+ antiporter-2